jgi:hypothetical protein
VRDGYPFWIDPKGKEHALGGINNHERWAWRHQGQSSQQLLSAGWIRVAPPDAVQIATINDKKTLRAAQSVISALLRAGSEYVWLETDEDNFPCSLGLHGELKMGQGLGDPKGVDKEGEMTHNLSTLTTPPPNETPLDSTSSGSEEQLVKMGRFLRIRRS